MGRRANGQVGGAIGSGADERLKRWRFEIGGRVKHARQAIGLTQERFAREAGAKSKSGLQDNERGRSMPGGHIIGTLAKYRVNTNWIFTGEGDMMLPRTSGPETGGATAPHMADSAGSPRGNHLDVQLLQGVIDFFFRWLAEHGVDLAQKKYGAAIAVLYHVAMTRGRIEYRELEQVLQLTM